MQARWDTTENCEITKAVEKVGAGLLLTKPCSTTGLGTHSNYVQDRFETDTSSNFRLQTQQVVNFWSCGTEETNNSSTLDKKSMLCKVD